MDIGEGEHNDTDTQLTNPPLNPTADAIAEHQDSEHLAALFYHKSRNSLRHHDHQTDIEKLFGGIAVMAIDVDDTPLWQVLVKVHLYHFLAIYIADSWIAQRRTERCFLYFTAHHDNGGARSTMPGKVGLCYSHDAWLHICGGAVS